MNVNGMLVVTIQFQKKRVLSSKTRKSHGLQRTLTESSENHGTCNCCFHHSLSRTTPRNGIPHRHWREKVKVGARSEDNRLGRHSFMHNIDFFVCRHPSNLCNAKKNQKFATSPTIADDDKQTGAQTPPSPAEEYLRRTGKAILTMEEKLVRQTHSMNCRMSTVVQHVEPMSLTPYLLV